MTTLKTHSSVSPADVAELMRHLEERWPREIRRLRSSEKMLLLDGDDDDGGDAGDAGEADDDGSEGDDDESEPEGEGDEEGDGESAALKAEKKRNQALSRRLAESEKERKKAQRANAARKEAEAEEAGEFKELAETRGQEIGDLKTKLRDVKFDTAVGEIAQKLRFRNPRLAHRLVSRDLRDTAVDEDYEVDERLIERELKTLAKNDEYLVHPEEKRQAEVRGDQEQRRGRSNGGSGDGEYKFDPRSKMRENRPASVGRGGRVERGDS